jgi:hypothetical protein
MARFRVDEGVMAAKQNTIVVPANALADAHIVAATE